MYDFKQFINFIRFAFIISHTIPNGLWHESLSSFNVDVENCRK